MLKRYQVLLPDWLEDYIQYGANKHDLSFSEIIRLEICLSILLTTTCIYPEFKPGITPEEICSTEKNHNKSKVDINGTHRIISKIYFEARKAVEYRLDKEKSQKK